MLNLATTGFTLKAKRRRFTATWTIMVGRWNVFGLFNSCIHLPALSNLLVPPSVIREILACGIRNFENLAFEIRNLEDFSLEGIRNAESKFHWQQFGIQQQESRIQEVGSNLKLSWIPLYVVNYRKCCGDAKAPFVIPCAYCSM